MTDLERQGLHGAVLTCVEERINPAQRAGDREFPEARFTLSFEFDRDGRLLVQRSTNSDGSAWTFRKSYDDRGRLLKTSSGREGEKANEVLYSYDDNGRLVKITDNAKPETPTVFSYDAHGGKRSVVTQRPSDYRPNVAVSAEALFDVASMAPNLLGGGTATTLYDEHDRAVEVQVRDASGEIVNRVVRRYDSRGNVVEEKPAMDDPITMIPREARAAMLQAARVQEPNLDEQEFNTELRAKLKETLGAGDQGSSSEYDEHNRLVRTRQRIFSLERTVDINYNDHGDKAREVTRTAPPGSASTPALRSNEYSEVRHEYQYDEHGNWTEQRTSYRSAPDAGWTPGSVVRRTLTYF